MMNDKQTTIAELTALMNDFIAERAWEPFHDAKNLSASIAIEAAELMEHFQWLRTDQLPALRGDSLAMEAIREEIADVFAYVLSFASRMNIDLSAALESKMKKNAQRYPVEEFHGRFRK
jgi:NTP pyrophosphatase (non-canonical NTP hydrolase)